MSLPPCLTLESHSSLIRCWSLVVRYRSVWIASCLVVCAQFHFSSGSYKCKVRQLMQAAGLCQFFSSASVISVFDHFHSDLFLVPLDLFSSISWHVSICNFDCWFPKLFDRTWKSGWLPRSSESFSWAKLPGIQHIMVILRCLGALLFIFLDFCTLLLSRVLRLELCIADIQSAIMCGAQRALTFPRFHCAVGSCNGVSGGG
jgi:hypothetical protein